MKKIRLSAGIMLLVLAMSMMTAGCGNKNNTGKGSTTGTTAGQTSTSATTESGVGTSGVTSGAAGESGSGAITGTREDESSTGVIDGLVDDVEDGVRDITGDTTSSAAADESR